MSELTIKTNNVPRDIIYWWDLTDKERKEFDYLDNEDKQMEANFFRYRKCVYHLGDIMRIDNNAPFPKGWDGYESDTFFSGILVKYVNDYDQVIVATYYS